MLRELFGTSKPKPQAQPPKPSVTTPGPRRDSVLGANTHWEGALQAEGNIRVDGTFIGDISTQGRIIIGEQGNIEGNLIGDAVETAGVVKGNVIARKVVVTRTGRILGDLRLEKMMTEEGGFIQGLVSMEEKVDISAHLPGQKEPEAAEEKKAELKAEVEPEKVKVTVRAGKG